MVMKIEIWLQTKIPTKILKEHVQLSVVTIVHAGEASPMGNKPPEVT